MSDLVGNAQLDPAICWGVLSGQSQLINGYASNTMDDQLVTIKSFSLPWEADLARATLEAQGIPAVVADAHTVSMNWLWSNAIGGVKLQVPEKFVEAATKALAFQPEPSPSDSQEEIDAPTCPRCGNRHSTIIRLGRRWTFLTWLLFDIPLFFPPKRCKCLKCGEVWKPTISVLD